MLATQVTVKNGNLDLALRKCKKRESYIKPGVARRAAKKEGIKNSNKRNRKDNRD